ncbi:DUF3089 domain-containing protein [Maricaulis salignorans]|uniref:DUF3089 domain-containing protein n=1 Tax=Maricaulis salignorans TaxID=144026 RepID=A0A1G9P8N1_9PROT|nr:DUF3089 domain-containing protein [Maricaulis salignorans]SDL94577.1 Protein of unknown function [Maricaulis salignorans]
MSLNLIARHAFLLACLVLAALLLVAAWVLRDQVYRTFQDPGVPFQTYTPPEGADYAEAAGWYVREAFANDDEPAVFFVHPTTYSGGGNWNGQLDKPSSVEAVTEIVLPNYAAPFGNAGALHAPRYRQASLYAFMNNREDSVRARLFAYEDVQRAFDAFTAQIGDSRPIILAGYGQGGLDVLGLLLDRFAGDADLQTRLVAAYVIESPVPLDLFAGPLNPIAPCITPEDVRCVYAFTSAMASEEDRIHIITERAMSWTPDGQLDFVDGRGLLCVNPLLSAVSNEYASARQHRGGVAAEGLDPDAVPAPIPAQTGAQCADGVLFFEQPRSRALHRPRRLVEDYRLPPFNLFYEDLRFDVARRSLNLATILQDERQWAPAFDAPEAIEDAPVIAIPDRRRY